MDLNLLKTCDINDLKNHPSGQGFESVPDEKTMELEPEDEISLDSIFSTLVDRIVPAEDRSPQMKFEVTAKDLISEKQAIIFEEKLYISKFKKDSCQINKEPKVFVENDVEEVGTFKMSVEESYDGYVVYGKSKMLKDKGKFKSGHWVRGKYDDRLNLICEKRGEYDFVDDARIEKILDGRIVEDKLIVKREIKINNDSQHFKAVINVKNRKDAFILDAGILLLTRYLIINKIWGEFNYFSLNLIGKFIRCQLTVREDSKAIKIFHRTFTNVIHVRNTQYFNNNTQETSDTFYTADGKMILHYWHNFNYLLHETKGFIPKREVILPKMELMWRNQYQLLDQYRLKKQLTYDNAMEVIEQHPELADFLHDYILNVLKYKPRNILEFSVRFFHKFKVLGSQRV